MEIYRLLRKTLGLHIAESFKRGVSEAMHISDVYIDTRPDNTKGLAFKINGTLYKYAMKDIDIDFAYDKMLKMMTFSHYRAFSWVYQNSDCYYGDKPSKRKLAKKILSTHSDYEISEEELYQFLLKNNLNDTKEFYEYIEENPAKFINKYKNNSFLKKGTIYSERDAGYIYRLREITKIENGEVTSSSICGGHEYTEPIESFLQETNLHLYRDKKGYLISKQFEDAAKILATAIDDEYFEFSLPHEYFEVSINYTDLNPGGYSTTPFSTMKFSYVEDLEDYTEFQGRVRVEVTLNIDETFKENLLKLPSNDAISNLLSSGEFVSKLDIRDKIETLFKGLNKVKIFTERKNIKESKNYDKDLINQIAKDLKLYLDINTDAGYINAAKELVDEFELYDMDDYYRVSLKDIKKFLCL